MAIKLEDSLAQYNSKPDSGSDERTKKVLKEGKRLRSLVKRTRAKSIRA